MIPGRSPLLLRYSGLRMWLCLLAIAGLTYLFLWRLWANVPADRATLPIRSDLTEVFFPPRYYVSKTLAAGDFPLWNPHVYSGYPQFADPQAATFYPIALALALLAHGQFTLDWVAFDIGLHFFLAGAFTFLFLRRIIGSDLPALAGAVVFEFGGYLTGYPPLQLSELEGAVWLPATLLVLTLAIDRRSARWAALAGAVMGLVFLAGRPQSYLTVAPVSLAWLAYWGRHHGLDWRRIAGWVVLLVGFALGIAAIQWGPTLQLTRLSTRAHLTYPLVSEGGFPFWEFTGMFLPSLVGSYNLYVGILTLAMAALALYRRRGLFWAAPLAGFLLGSFGKHLILFDGLYLIERVGFPGYLRNVERLAFGITFCLAALAGHGVDQLLRERPGLPLALTGVLAGVGGGAALVAWGWSLTPLAASIADPHQPLDSLAFVGEMTGVGVLALWLSHDRRQLAQIAFVALIATDVMTMNHGRFYAVNQRAQMADLDRAAAAPPGASTFYRLAADQLIAQDFGSVLGIDNVGGMPPLDLRAYRLLLNSVDEYRRNVLLNVEVVATGGAFPDLAYKLLTTVGDYRYYRFVPAHPRAYLVRSVINVPDEGAAATQIAAPDFDYWATAVVTGRTGLGTGLELSPRERAEVIGRTANALTVTVTAEAERLLVVVEADYPGWTAQIDGVPTKVYPTNVALRGLIVPPGTHTVVMRFRPPVAVACAAISALTLIGWLVWFMLDVLRRQWPPFRLPHRGR